MTVQNINNKIFTLSTHISTGEIYLQLSGQFKATMIVLNG